MTVYASSTTSSMGGLSSVSGLPAQVYTISIETTATNAYKFTVTNGGTPMLVAIGTELRMRYPHGAPLCELRSIRLRDDEAGAVIMLQNAASVVIDDCELAPNLSIGGAAVQARFRRSTIGDKVTVFSAMRHPIVFSDMQIGDSVLVDAVEPLQFDSSTLEADAHVSASVGKNNYVTSTGRVVDALPDQTDLTYEDPALTEIMRNM